MTSTINWSRRQPSVAFKRARTAAPVDHKLRREQIPSGCYQWFPGEMVRGPLPMTTMERLRLLYSRSPEN